MFVAGPPVVARLGQALDKQELGGGEIQTRAGAVDDAVDTEEEAFDRARRFLSYLPSSVHDLPPVQPCDDDPRARRRDADEARSRATGARSTRCARSSRRWSTRAASSRWARNFGRSVITGLARLDGRPVLLLASDPFHYGGAWTADACQKVMRFVDLAETFHLPVVYLMDCPGFMIGLEAEKQRHHPPRRARDGGGEPDARCRGARSSCAMPSASPARRTSRPGGSRCAMPGRRPTGARCRWKAASRRPIAPRSRPRRRPEGQAERDRGPAEHAALAVPHGRDASGSRRSSTRASTRSLLCEFARLAEPLRTPGHARFAMRP